MSQETFDQLLRRIHQVNDLIGATSLLGWDQQALMPQRGAAVRGERLATLAGLAHSIFTSDETGELLDKASDFANGQGDDSFEASLWRIVKRNYDKQKRIPTQLAEERERAANAGYEAWHTARAAADFSQFEAAMSRNLELTLEVVRIQKDAMGAEDDYDVLLDDYEPGMKASDVDRVFDRLKEATRPLVQLVAERGDDREQLVHGHFPKAAQEDLSFTIARQIGFTDDAWRLDVSPHPFTSSMAINDIRITTKYVEDFLNPSLFATMHEFGHGLYEHQVAESLERTPLARGASMMWHESQSRMWENLVGRGRPFWTWAMPKVQEAFPDQFANVTADDMHRAVNTMGPSLIRIEADELTYNLHIILRYELERAMLAGEVAVSDLPEAWNAKVKDYLGLDVPNDAEGVLQDVHWGSGSIGYFPTYALGNVLAAMLWSRISSELPNLTDDFARGEFASLRTWLGENIHQHGSKYMPMDLLDKVLGVRQLDAEPLIDYLTAKVNDLYG
ncbi:MAG TPA: carboxypeptidase M32 [Thermomicrobiales bacterium]|nr:carboxypeptidase M32 [Thermomicrobiales bacterium]